MTRQVVVSLLTLATLVGLTLAVDAVTATSGRPAGGGQDTMVVNSGTWYCPMVASGDDEAVVSVGAVGDEATQISVQRFVDGERGFDPTMTLQPGTTERIEVPAGEQAPSVVIRWRGGPAVASWHADRRRERVGAVCAASPSPRWLVSGLDTTLGSRARLYLFNPFETDAVARLSFATPEGRVDLVSTENIPVRAGTMVDVDITELQPEQPDLGLLIDVEAGRLVPAAIQRLGQPDEPSVNLDDLEELEGEEQTLPPLEPEGRMIVPAAPAGTPSAGFAYAAIGEATDSWVSVLNPSSTQATVEVQVTDPIQASSEPTTVSVAPESVERIPLENLSSAPIFGLMIEATNDVPIAANGFLAVTSEQPAVTAVAGVPSPDTTLAIPASDPSTAPELVLYNPGGTVSTARLSVRGAAPAQWEAVELPPDSVETFALADVERLVGSDGPVVVTADQPVLGTVRLATTDDRFQGLLATRFVTASLWRGPVDVPSTERDRTLETTPVGFATDDSE